MISPLPLAQSNFFSHILGETFANAHRKWTWSRRSEPAAYRQLNWDSTPGGQGCCGAPGGKRYEPKKNTRWIGVGVGGNLGLNKSTFKQIPNIGKGAFFSIGELNAN